MASTRTENVVFQVFEFKQVLFFAAKERYKD